MWTYDYDENAINIRDSVLGTVIGHTSTGLLLELSDGQPAYTPFGGLNVGSVVECTYLGRRKNNRRAYVTVDSVVKRVAA